VCTGKFIDPTVASGDGDWCGKLQGVRLTSRRIMKRKICETLGSHPSGKFTGDVESAHSRRSPPEKWQVNGTGGMEKGERLFTTDRKSDPSPRRRQPPMSPFRAREQLVSPNPPLSHSPGWVFISLPSPRYQIEESGHFSNYNVIPLFSHEATHWKKVWY